jgi:hypothetical protein
MAASFDTFGKLARSAFFGNLEPFRRWHREELVGPRQARRNAFGGGLFFTSNNYGGTLSITDTTMTGNTGGHWTNVQSGTITNIGTAVGTNCKSITVQNSTIQGYP